MKIRNGFVSNSSSSSFVVGKDGLTKEQISAFEDFIYRNKDDDDEDYDDDTNIINGSKYFFGTVSYHNNKFSEMIKDNNMEHLIEWG